MNKKNLIVFTLFFSIPRVTLSYPCPATDNIDAIRKYQEGVTAIERDDYLAALRAFEQSYLLSPKPGMLYNISMCQKALLRHADAIRTFERLLEESGSEIEPFMRQDAENAIRELKKMVGTLRVFGTPEDSQVILSGKLVGKIPIEELIIIDPGNYPMRVVKEGYEPKEIEVTITAKTDSVVNVTLQITPINMEVPEEIPLQGEILDPVNTPREEEDSRPSALFWTGLSTTVVAGALTGIFFGLMSAKVDDYNTKNSELGAMYANPQGYDSNAAAVLNNDVTENKNAALKYNKIAGVMTITTGILALGSGIILIVDLNGNVESTTSLSTSLSLNGLTLVGTF